MDPKNFMKGAWLFLLVAFVTIIFVVFFAERVGDKQTLHNVPELTRNYGVYR